MPFLFALLTIFVVNIFSVQGKTDTINQIGGVSSVQETYVVNEKNNSDKGGLLLLMNGATHTINGGTIRGGCNVYGGAFYVGNGCTLTINNGIITGCNAKFGGAIYIENGGTVNLYGGRIYGNTAEDGPAIFVEDGGVLHNNGCVIEDNEYEFFGYTINFYIDGTLNKSVTSKSKTFALNKAPLSYEECPGYYRDEDMLVPIEVGEELKTEEVSVQTVIASEDDSIVNIYTKTATLDKIEFVLNNVDLTYAVKQKNTTDTTGVVVVPRQYNGKSVSSVLTTNTQNDGAFYNNKNITAIYLPNIMTQIGNYAFKSCSNLVTLNIPANVTIIGKEAFNGCGKLAGDFIIPSGVTSIGQSSFYGCNKLVGEITIPATVTSIGDQAFYGCSGITSIVIPKSVKDIGNQVFTSCTNAKNIYYTGTTEDWLKMGFGYLWKTGAWSLSICDTVLTDLVIPDSVTGISRNIFNDCTSLTSVLLNENITRIGSAAFCGCTSLTGDLIIPDNILKIDSSAFENCRNLTKIEIGSGVNEIGSGAFASCSSVETMIVDSQNSVYDSRSDCNAIIATNTNTLLFGCKNTVIPNDIVKINNNAFEKSQIQSIVIPDSVTSIENYAFYYSGLKSVTFGNGLRTIGSSAFNGCTSLSGSLIIPDSVTVVSSWAFQSCPITELKLSANLTAIGDGAFWGTKITSVEIPEGVTTIPYRAFYGCSHLQEIKIPATVTQIGRGAFSQCTSLRKIFIPSTVSTIVSGSAADSIFYQCSGLLTIYTDIENSSSIPNEWGAYWTYYNNTNQLTVNYNISREEYDELE